MITYELSPEYDSAKSFYGKAKVLDHGVQKLLHSYDTHVATIANGGVILMDAWEDSATTLRHVKEFLKQNGFDAPNKAYIREHYTWAA